MGRPTLSNSSSRSGSEGTLKNASWSSLSLHGGTHKQLQCEFVPYMENLRGEATMFVRGGSLRMIGRTGWLEFASNLYTVKAMPFHSL